MYGVSEYNSPAQDKDFLINYKETENIDIQSDMLDLLDQIPSEIMNGISKKSDEFVKKQKNIDSKFRHVTKRQYKSFTAEVIAHARRLELKSYELCRKWKREFRYDLVSDFRHTVSNIRRCLIMGYSVSKQFVDEKIYNFNLAQAELDELESIMWIMIQPSINVMSNIEWAEFAYEIDAINNMLEKIINSIKHTRSELES